MFEAARLKLTLWYLAIIMLVSIMFSVAIYKWYANEFYRIERVQRIRQESLEGQAGPSRVFHFDPEVVEESRSRIRLALIILNFIILGLAGGAGYFLAGRTLRPIEQMIDEQAKFITGASHELRTPLTALKTSIEVGLRDKKLGVKDAKELLRENLEEVENLKNLSDGLLRLSQFEKVNGGTTFEAVKIGDILEEARRKVGSLAKAKGIEISVFSVKGKVKAERASLVELFVILLDNAIKYSPKNSKVEVNVSNFDKHLKISVADHGMGISKYDLANIFERFYRGDKARSKANVSGYGLGLSIAKKISQVHGGTIGVESAVGKGSTFSVVLPQVS